MRLPSIVVSPIQGDNHASEYQEDPQTSSSLTTPVIERSSSSISCHYASPLMPIVATHLAWRHRKWRTMSSLRSHHHHQHHHNDVETGGDGQHHHTSKKPYTPAASPREMFAQRANLSSSVSHVSPHGARFMDGYRRRIRQCSLNLPTDTKLDEDLGFPPICSPPPEVYTGSVGDNRTSTMRAFSMRERCNSDAISMGSRRASSGNCALNGGLLVFFPTSPSSSSNHSPAPINSYGISNSRHESSTDETAWPMEDDVIVDEVSLKEGEQECTTAPERNPEAVGSSSPRTCYHQPAQQQQQHQQNVNSPRSRPLYVDTQMANASESLKRKSPVTQMVDFVRGRNRTYSLQLSSSPMSPQSVAARASASCDTHSPGRRQTVSGRVHRSSFTAGSGAFSIGGPKSFDSGLDLTSPTINHTALLIKEASLFSSFDSMSIGTAVPDINAIFFDNHDAVYSLFMKAHKCYDLIPTSTKLVVFDTHLPVRKAFYALVYNGVRAAPLWNAEKQQFTGMLTITDFIKILCKHYDKGDNAERIRALEDQQISHWREQFEQDGTLRPFVSIDPTESLHRAVEVLCESKVHRLPVLDRKTGNITYILTHKRIMKFLSLYLRDLPKPGFMSQTPKELGIGAWGNILCCHVDTPIHDALELFLKNRVSALPLIDKDGKVVDIYAKFDVISLAAENSYDKLDCTVQEALKHRSEWFEGVQTCLETDSLFQVMEAIVKAEVHRLIVTDIDKKVVGVISLSDILKYLVLDPCQESLPAELPSRTASGTSTGNSSDSPPSSIPEGIEVDEEAQEA